MGFGTDGYHKRSAVPTRASHVVSDRFWGQGRGAMTDPVGGVVTIIVTALLLGLIFLLIPIIEALPHLFSKLDHYLTRLGLAIVCGLSATIVGISLFELRTHARGIYALLELAFAFATAAASVTKLSGSEGDMNVWFGFAGAAYLVVRGLDNIKTARAEHHWPWRVRSSSILDSHVTEGVKSN